MLAKKKLKALRFWKKVYKNIGITKEISGRKARSCMVLTNPQSSCKEPPLKLKKLTR